MTINKLSKDSVSRFALERLRLNVKVLSYSARLNRKAKKIASNKAFFQKEHMFVSENARYHHLAYAFLTGRPYGLLERTTTNPPDFQRVRQLIVQYEPQCGYHHFQMKPEWEASFQDWLNG